MHGTLVTLARGVAAFPFILAVDWMFMLYMWPASDTLALDGYDMHGRHWRLHIAKVVGYTVDLVFMQLAQLLIAGAVYGVTTAIVHACKCPCYMTHLVMVGCMARIPMSFAIDRWLIHVCNQKEHKLHKYYHNTKRLARKLEKIEDELGDRKGKWRTFRDGLPELFARQRKKLDQVVSQHSDEVGLHNVVDLCERRDWWLCLAMHVLSVVLVEAMLMGWWASHGCN